MKLKTRRCLQMKVKGAMTKRGREAVRAVKMKMSMMMRKREKMKMVRVGPHLMQNITNAALARQTAKILSHGGNLRKAEIHSLSLSMESR
jgi:hypothetical protein